MRRHRLLVIASVAAATMGMLTLPTPAGAVPTHSPVAASKPAAAARPARVSKLRAFDLGHVISLQWTNPTSRSVRQVVVRYSRGRNAPSDPSRGNRVHLAHPKAEQAVVRHLAANTTYTVAVWTQGRSTHYSWPVTITFTTAAHPAPTGTYAGVVTDDAGHPLAHAEVDALDVSSVSSASFATTTDQQGRFRLILPRAHYVAGAFGEDATGGNADATGYIGSWHAVTIRSHRTRRVALALKPGGAVTGRVTDSSGNPLRGVDAYLADVVAYVPISDGVIFPFNVPEYETTTAADGTFTLKGVWSQAFMSCYSDDGSATGGTTDAQGYAATCAPASGAVGPGGTRSLGDVALASAAGATISGRITDQRGRGLGASLVSFTLHGKRYPSATTTSAAGGAYSVAGLATGNYQICVVQSGVATTRSSITGYAPRCRKAEVAANPDHAARANLALHVGAAITGTITGPGHARMTGVYVSVDQKGDDGDSTEATTDRYGHYTLTGLDSGPYRVCFDTQSATGRGAPTGAAPACFGRRIELRAGYTRTGIDRQLRPAGAVSGRVLDGAGRPVGGIEVDVEPAGATFSSDFGFAQTDAHGRYTAVGVGAGKYTVCVESFVANTSTVQACRRGAVRVRAGKFTRKADVTVRQSASIVASAHDAHGRPVSGVDAVLLARCHNFDDCNPQPLFSPSKKVAVRGSDLTGSDGTVEFDNLAPGAYAVCLFAYYGATASDNPSTGWADRCSGSTLNVVVAKGGRATSSQVLNPAGLISGQVTDSGGHPLQGVVVRVSHSAAADYVDYLAASNGPSGPQADSVTAADGTYAIRSVQPGSQTVCFSAAHAQRGTSTGGYLDQCIGGAAGGKNDDGTAVTVTAGASTSGADLALTSGGAFAGTVLDGSGHAVKKADVVLFDSAGDEVGDKLSSATGQYTLARIPAGSYAICFYSGARFAGQCYDHVAWNERTVPTSAADLVPDPGVTTGGIDATLHT